MIEATDVALEARELAELASTPAWVTQVESLADALDDAAAGTRAVSETTSAWAELDLHRTFSPAAFESGERTDPMWLAWVEIARIVGIFVPIVITWFGIWVASEAYSALLVDDPEAARQPFIALWQTGFGGRVWGGMTLARVAFLDFGFILFVIGLTIVASVTRHRHDRRLEAHHLFVRSDIEATLSRAALVLAGVRLSAPARFQGELVSASSGLNTLLARLEMAADRIGNSIERSATLASSLDQTMTGLLAAGTVLADAAKGLETSVGSAQSAAEAALAGEQANAAANEAVLREVRDAATALRSMSSDFSNAADKVADVVDGMVATQTDLKAALATERRHQTALAKSSTVSAEQLQEATTQLAAVTAGLPDLAVTIERTSGSLDSVYNRLGSEVQNVISDTGELLGRQVEVNDLLRRTIATVEVGVEQMRASVLDMNVVLSDTIELLRGSFEETIEGARPPVAAGAEGTGGHASA